MTLDQGMAHLAQTEMDSGRVRGEIRERGPGMAERVTDPEALAVWEAALHELIEKVNGFVYHGDRATAIWEAVGVLREDPDLARRLGIGDVQDR